MWFHKPTKQAFVLLPKTGSTTAQAFLHKLGWKFIGEHHSYPSEMIVKYPNLAGYSIYGFVRDPLARFESCILFLKQIPSAADVLTRYLHDHKINKTREEITYDEVVDMFDQLDNYNVIGGIFRPQYLWFDAPNVTALDYQGFEYELRRITNNHDEPIQNYNVSTNFGRGVITQKVKDFVRKQYAADYEFAKNALGKEY
jgi:hypothetical protein